MRLGTLPDWAMAVAVSLCESKHVDELADQVIVNEYLPGQGIAQHVDCIPCFTDSLVSVSLASECVMNFTNKATHQVESMLLEPRSAIILKSDARYIWTHGIPARKRDEYEGRTIERKRRVSLTFRKVILKNDDSNITQ